MTVLDYLYDVGHEAARNLFNRTARRADPKRPRRATLEALESRLLLSASMTINAANQLAFLGDPGNDDVTVSFAPNAAGGTYTINDSAAPVNVVANNGSAVTTAGSGTNTVTVTNLSSLASASLSFDGNGNGGVAPGDTFNIQSTNDLIAIDQTGPAAVHDTFNLGNTADGVQSILAPVSLQDTSGAADVTIDDSADANDQTFTLAGGPSVSTISHLAPGLISYANGEISSLTINGGNGNDDFTVDFSGGNPIPTLSTPGLIYSGGGGSDNVLNLVGVPPSGQFASVVPKATGRGSGSITFVDQDNISTELTYADLTPITDTTPSVDYTFNDLGFPDQSFSATDGPVIAGTQTIQFASTPTPSFPLNFETTDIANKNFVTFNTPPETPGVAGPGILATVNVPTASTGLLSLTFDTLNDGDNTITFVNTPPGVVTSLNDGAGSATTNVTGTGVAGGTVLFLNGGPGANTLNYNAGGITPTVTPGLLPGEVLISISGAGIVDAVNYTQINITDVSPPVISPGPLATIDSVEDTQSVNAVVGTFSAPVPLLPPSGGFPASDFTASINWGDTSTAAGTITQNASDPSVYSITCTHTFTENGVFTVTNTVAFAGATYTAPVNGVPISITIGPAGPSAGTPATDFVHAAPLTGSAGNEITGFEGSSTGTVLLGAFTDGNQAATVADYTTPPGSVVVNWGDGSAPQTLAASNLTGIGSPNGAEWAVDAAHTYVEEGTYAYTVTVSDADGAATIVSGSAVIADAALTAGPAIHLTRSTGVALPGTTIVGAFTDGNSFATTSDFTDLIDWGDGSPQSTGVIVPTATPGVFDVEAGHSYAKPGVYTTLVTVHDDGGSQVVIEGSATVTTPAPPTNIVASPVLAPRDTILPGANTGTIEVATFTDAAPESLGHYKATITWGDGHTSTGAITLSSGVFIVKGSNSYASAGDYSPKVTIQKDSLTPKSVTDTDRVDVLVTAHIATDGGVTFNGLEGRTVSPTLANFTAVNTSNPANDYSAMINWGDGTANTVGTVVSTGGGHFHIVGTHVYHKDSTYTVTITLKDIFGDKVLIKSTAKIADAPLELPTGKSLTVAHGSTFTNLLIGSFRDDDATNTSAAEYVGTINWGDGSSTSLAKFILTGATANLGSYWNVEGTHKYATAKTYTVTISIHDVDSSVNVILITTTIKAT
ncbi:MAG: LEPR-XLL domain-containing protein [Tepidisphaeraceae bacterium]